MAISLPLLAVGASQAEANEAPTGPVLGPMEHHTPARGRKDAVVQVLRGMRLIQLRTHALNNAMDRTVKMGQARMQAMERALYRCIEKGKGNCSAQQYMFDEESRKENDKVRDAAANYVEGLKPLEKMVRQEIARNIIRKPESFRELQLDSINSGRNRLTELLKTADKIKEMIDIGYSFARLITTQEIEKQYQRLQNLWLTYQKSGLAGSRGDDYRLSR